MKEFRQLQAKDVGFGNAGACAFDHNPTCRFQGLLQLSCGITRPREKCDSYRNQLDTTVLAPNRGDIFAAPRKMIARVGDRDTDSG